MLFSSPVFAVFFLADYLAHLSVPARYRTYLIICASTVFYAWWKLEYTWVPFLLMAIAYGGGHLMEAATTQSLRKAWATATIAALFVPLVVFKYTDFIYRDVLGPFLGLDGTLLGVPLPLGI